MYIEDNDFAPTKRNKIIWSNEDNMEKYGLGYISNTQKEIDEQIKNKTNKNYYIKNEKTSLFKFGDYKTFKYYGVQTIEVRNPLKNVIDRHIKMQKLKKGDKLLNLSYSNYLKRLTNIFMQYSNKSISIDMLRHIYINYILSKNFSDNTLKYFSIMMGHNTKSQAMYRKIIKTN